MEGTGVGGEWDNWFKKGGCSEPGKMARWCESSSYGIEVDVATTINEEKNILI